jgi:hypothetical protein
MLRKSPSFPFPLLSVKSPGLGLRIFCLLLKTPKYQNLRLDFTPLSLLHILCMHWTGLDGLGTKFPYKNHGKGSRRRRRSLLIITSILSIV